MSRVIQKLTVDFGPPEGAYHIVMWPDGKYSVGGKPSPSESEAHVWFTDVIPALHKFFNMSLEELREFAHGDAIRTAG